MRKLAVLLLIAAPVLAEDDAAALFYKGFWLEQAEGKLDEAAALYGKLLSEKPDAPEAPRALLGLVRIKVAKNEDAKELVAELERRYPAAKEEIAGAKRVAVQEKFDFEVRPFDSPVAAKLKSLYMQQGNWQDADQNFLIDLGSASHPMLAQLLRSSDAFPVGRAAQVLVAQRTPEAFALLSAALVDDTGLFRSRIVGVLRGGADVPAIVIDALAKLYERSAPRLRVEVVETLATLAFGKGREQAFAVLTRALTDQDEAVRAAAFVGVANTDAPDRYLVALLQVVESGRSEPSYVAPNLLRFGDRVAFRDRIERIVEARILQTDALPNPLPEEGAVVLARVIVKNQGNGRAASSALSQRAAQASPRAAALLLMAAIETGEESFAKIKLNGDVARKYLGEEADKVRTAAIAAASGTGEEYRRADEEVLKVVGVTEADFPSVLEGLRRRGKKSFPLVLLDKERLLALGPAKAGALVESCGSERDVQALLHAGRDFAQRNDAGVEFFRRALPRAGPGAAGDLYRLASRPELATLVADRLLSAEGAEWAWGARLRANGGYFQAGESNVLLSHDQTALKYPGPYAWRAARREAVAGEGGNLLRHVGDKRPEIAISAAAAAAEEKGDAGTAALKIALHSDTPEARAIALYALASRVADGPALVREFARRANLAAEDRAAVASVLADGPAYAPVAAELLRLGTWPELWPVYQEIAPKECVELALVEAVGDKEGDQRLGAVNVLTQVGDPRRIEVFRKILKGTDGAAIMEVLGAVRDQYLVELGEEALAQLRNPDQGIRATATEAIDKLKFYAEAKKAFEK